VCQPAAGKYGCCSCSAGYGSVVWGERLGAACDLIRPKQSWCAITQPVLMQQGEGRHKSQLPHSCAQQTAAPLRVWCTLPPAQAAKVWSACLAGDTSALCLHIVALFAWL
jgi:hypothetical protein